MTLLKSAFFNPLFEAVQFQAAANEANNETTFVLLLSVCSINKLKVFFLKKIF